MDPAQQEGRLKDVVDNEMTPDIGSGVNISRVFRKKMPYIADLEDQEHNPVDVCDERVEGERGWIVFVLAPDGSSCVVPFVLSGGGVEAVEKAEDED